MNKGYVPADAKKKLAVKVETTLKGIEDGWDKGETKDQELTAIEEGLREQIRAAYKEWDETKARITTAQETI